MREAGVGFVTLGVFSWGLLEPEPERYEFGWFDEVLALLHDAGIAVDLATATAAPPPWLTTRAPGDPPGRRRRPHAVAGQPAVLVPQLAGVPRARPAARRRDGPPLRQRTPPSGSGTSATSWAATTARCWCDVSAAAFRRWLTDRYGVDRRAQRRLGHRVLVAALRRLRRRCCRRGSRRRCRTRPTRWTSPASAPTSCCPTTGPSATCCGRCPPGPGDHEPHVISPPERAGLLPLGAGAGRRLPGPLPRPPAARPAGRAGVLRRPDPRGGRRARRGC